MKYRFINEKVSECFCWFQQRKKESGQETITKVTINWVLEKLINCLVTPLLEGKAHTKIFHYNIMGVKVDGKVMLNVCQLWLQQQQLSPKIHKM